MATPVVQPENAPAPSPAVRRTEQLLTATYEAEQRHFWFIGLRRFLTPLIERAAAGRPNLRLLDCGCGTGANLKLLARFGEQFGFDLSAVGPRFARRYGQTRLAQASITHTPFPDAAFDIVTAIDVLYTLEEEDERLALNELYRVLRPGGTLIINVAALNLLRGTHSARSNEVRRSSRRRLRRVLQQAGFTVERLTYTNCSLFPLMLAVRLAQRLFGRASRDTGLEMQVPPGVVNMPLTALLVVESWLLRVMDMPVGSSLLSVARKP